MKLHIKQFGVPEADGMQVIDLTTNPSPAIMARGLGDVSHSQYFLKLDQDGTAMPNATTDKPIYSVPTLAQIREIPWNGYKVASTFSGGGGSCTGYRMAGFRVVWANEFVPAAQESYKANASEHCFLDRRDIKLVQATDILQQCDLEPGELDLFDGSPPCQAFSTAGQRHKGWGKKKGYEHGAEQCNEQLFFDYVRLLEGLQPKTFVAENVSGLVKGTAKGMFLEILAALKATGYKVKCAVLDAQWLGVPQTRTRTIFIGVRNDLELDPVFPTPFPYRYTVADALPLDRPAPAVSASMQSPYGAHKVSEKVDDEEKNAGKSIEGYAIGDEWDNLKPGETSEKYFQLQKADPDQPSPAICASHGGPSVASVVHPTEKRKFTIDEVKAICSFPADYELKGKYAQQWERLGNSVPPLMMRAVSEQIRDKILARL